MITIENVSKGTLRSIPKFELREGGKHICYFEAVKCEESDVLLLLKAAVRAIETKEMGK